MSTPEQPATPALTRKQLRDIRNTGATPIVSADVPSVTAEDDPAVESAADATTASVEPPVEEVAVAEAPEAPAPPPAAPLPRAAVPVPVHDLPGADASVDLGVAPLTRRQARQQERIRTASVPVITPEIAAAHTAGEAAQHTAAAAEHTLSDAAPASTEDEAAHEEVVDLFDVSEAHAEPADEAAHDEILVEEVVAEESAGETAVPVESDERRHEEAPVETPAALDQDAAHDDSGHDDAGQDDSGHDDAVDDGDRAIVHPQFGAGLLAGESAHVDLPPSFDQLITRSVTGAIGTGNALILSQTPSAPPLVAPVTATGEVLITGSFDLPEGLGSTGHANGTADGKEADAVLIDGELPAHSSPTPIAASAAISTVKNGGDIIKPPAPEKGGRLMLTLAITAGALALALVGVLILAFVTGVF